MMTMMELEKRKMMKVDAIVDLNTCGPCALVFVGIGIAASVGITMVMVMVGRKMGILVWCSCCIIGLIILISMTCELAGSNDNNNG